MRPLFSLILYSVIAAPGLALAQDVPHLALLPAPAATPPEPALAPLPTVAPTRPAAPPIAAPPPPSAEAGAPAPELAPPTTVAPVIVAKDDKGGGVSGKVGTVAAGVAGGAAGAAVAGPVGKFAGGFLAKQLVQGVFGKKDKTPELTVIPQTPSAAGAGTPAVTQAETTVPKATRVADDR